MWNEIEKAWIATYSPRVITTFYKDVEKFSFKHGFFGKPSSHLSKTHQILYYLSLGFILEPIKNILKLVTLFPTHLLLLLSMKLCAYAEKNSNDLLLCLGLISMVFPAVMREIIGAVLTPIEMIAPLYRFGSFVYFGCLGLNIYLAWSLSIMLFPACSTVFMAIFLLNTVANYLVARESVRKNPGGFISGTPDDLALGIQNVDFKRLDKAYKDDESFRQFQQFDPNNMYCALSETLLGKKIPLGFTEKEIKEANDNFETAKLALESVTKTLNTREEALQKNNNDDGMEPEEELKKLRLDKEDKLKAFNQAKKEKAERTVVRWGEAFCLASALLELLPETVAQFDYRIVPPILTVAWSEKTTCCISLDVIDKAKGYRSFRGDYFSENIKPWLQDKDVCPITQGTLHMSQLQRINEKSSNKLSGKQLYKLKKKASYKLVNCFGCLFNKKKPVIQNNLSHAVQAYCS